MEIMRHLVRLTGLWKKSSKAGYEYLSGDVSPSSKLVILPNTEKGSDRDPDYIAYLTPAGQDQVSRPKKSKKWQDRHQEPEEGEQLQWWQKY